MIMTFLSATSFHTAGTLGSWMWQQDSINSGNSHLLMIFVGIAAFALFVQAAVLVGVAVGGLKAQREIAAHVSDLKAKILPLIATSHGAVTDLTPKIKEITATIHEISMKVNGITGHVGEIVAVVKEKVDEFSPTVSQANETFKEAMGKAKTTFEDANETVAQANQKTRDQVDRVNGMVSSALDATVKLAKAIEHGIGAPGREISGLVGGAKASIDSLVKKSGNVSNQLVGKIASMFAKNVSKPRSTPPRSSGVPIKPFGSMAASNLQQPVTPGPGVSSGSGGNGDVIVG